MRIRILLQITAEDGTPGEVKEVVAFEKETQRTEQIGLSLAEGQAMLAAVQFPERNERALSTAVQDNGLRCRSPRGESLLGRTAGTYVTGKIERPTSS